MLLRRMQREDDGQALVMVIGMMVLMSLILVVVVSSTVFGVNFTSKTRASVQSAAAAEAGIDQIAVAIMNDECSTVVDSSGNFDFSSSTPSFSGTVYRQAGASDAFVAGCPSTSDHAFKVVSTGTADQTGGGGFDSGDVETMEAVWVETVSPPVFDDAVRGDVSIATAGFAGLSAAGGDGNLYTKGLMSCPSGMEIEGNLVSEGNIQWNNNDCVVTGDVYVGGDLINMNGPYSSPTIGGDTVVLGSIKTSSGQAYGSFAQRNDGQYINTGGTVRVGGLIHAYCSYPGHYPNTNWDGFGGWLGNDCTVSPSTGTRVQMRVTGLSIPEPKPFEVVTVDYPAFTSWATQEWDTFGGSTAYGSFADGRRVASNVCKNHPWNGKGVITVTENTVIDTTSDCSKGLLMGDYGGLTINMSADLVIYANYFEVNGAVTINSIDGEAHSLYMIDPASSSFSSCPAVGTSAPATNSTNGGIEFTGSGAWAQASSVAVLMYTPGTFYAHRSGFQLGGQVYSCYSRLTSGFFLDFRRVGDASSTPSLSNYAVSYLRNQ